MEKFNSISSSFLNSTINNPGASLITKSRIFYFPKRASAERTAYFTARQYRPTYDANVFTAAPSVSADAGNVFTADSIELSAISKQETITNNLK